MVGRGMINKKESHYENRGHRLRIQLNPFGYL